MSKKKDEDSWRYSSIKRRDYRADHGTEEIPRHTGKKKDTKKWCKGKVGVEHSFRISRKSFNYFSLTKLRCENCGKEKWS